MDVMHGQYREENRQLPAADLLELMAAQRYACEYQPIIATGDGARLGYEALARFYNAAGQAISPLEVFTALHDSPLSLYQVEYRMKQLQLAHAPQGMLFLNLDQDAYAAYGELGENHPMVQMMRGRTDLVVEIIENTDISDAGISQAMARSFSAAQVQLALDDIGAPHSMLALPVLAAVDFIKLDRYWLSVREQPQQQALLRLLLEYARAQGKQVILEGVENHRDLAFARELGVEFVQGFLFREQFVQAGWQPRQQVA